MSGSRQPSPKRFTYADYLKWPEDEHWELIDGEAFNMSPAPSRDQSLIITKLATLFEEAARGGPCEVHSGHMEVKFSRKGQPDDRVKDVVIPDIVVVCDPEKLDSRGCKGPPDIIVEVLSPGSLSHDQVRKLNLYERNRVREYWIIQPEGSLMIFTLQRNGRYGRPKTFDMHDTVKVGLFPDLKIDLSRVFPKSLPVVRESPRKYLQKGKP